MKKWIKRAAMLLLAMVFLVSTARLIQKLTEQAEGAASYDSARELLAEAPVPAAPLPPESKPASDPVEQTAPEPAEPIPMKTIWVPANVDDPVLEELSVLDLSALQEVNGEVLGWIRIPDTAIDYPLLQGEDNTYYLYHTWDHQNSSVGSIFLEHLNSPDFTDYNTIIYGHNMNDGAMFAELKSFSEEEYWKAHPYIYIAANEEVYRYEIFSCYRAGLQDPTYGLSFNQETTKEKFLAHAMEKSVIQTGIEPPKTDRILTLSTCFGDGSNTRWVVHARLEMVEMQIPA